MCMLVARCVMALTSRSLADHRRNWALAMQAEFEAAGEDGRSLSFAVGCLVAAWREMPRYEEGRFVLANHALVFLLIIPMAAVLLSRALLGFPYVAFANPGPFGLSADGGPSLLLNEGSVAVAPSLTLAVSILAVTHLLVGWLLLERDWVRAAALVRLGAAATAALVFFTATSALDMTRIFMPIACLVTQSLAVLAIARWHDQLRYVTGPEAPT